MISHLLAAVLAAAGPNKQVRITVEDIAIAKTKPNRQPWDGDGSGPDVAGTIGLGAVDGDECKAAVTEQLPKKQNSYKVALDRANVIDAAASGICLEIRLIDRDVLDDDPIAAGRAKLKLGKNTLKLGPAVVSVNVEPIQAPSDAAARSSFEPPAPRPNLVRITLESAELKKGRPDGAGWDEASDHDAESEYEAGRLLTGALALYIGGPLAPVVASVGGEAGAAKATHAGLTNQAPDPAVVFRLGDREFRSPRKANTYAPSWSTSFLVDEDALATKPLRIEVLDIDDAGAETVGVELVAPGEVLAQPLFKRGFGQVGQLVLQVERVTESDEPTRATASLGSGAKWAKLPVVVEAGQLVHVRASGEICSRGTCFGPNGPPAGKRIEDPQLEGELVEGQLCAVVGEHAYALGTDGSFRSKSTGPLLLSIAEKEPTSGELRLEAEVYYPTAARP